MFKYFTFSELKKFRTVCRAWEKEARHVLSTETRKWKLAPITLNKDWGISKFLHLVGRQPAFFDFNNFHITGVIYDPKKSTIKSSKFLKLLSLCGHHITCLNLRYVAIKGKFVSFVSFLNELQHFCPNLEKLLVKCIFAVKESSADALSHAQQIQSESIQVFEKLTSLSVTAPVFSEHETFDQLGFDVYLCHIFKLVPNLEEFVYYDRTEKSLCHLDSIISTIRDVQLRKLNTLHLNTGRGDIHKTGQLEILGTLKLRSLKVGLDSFGLDSRSTKQEFSDFLQSQRCSLNTLQICFNIFDISNWLTFLTSNTLLPNLQELNVPYQIFTFSFLKVVPNLKKLVLRGNPKSSCWIEEASENSDNITLPRSTDISLSNSVKNWTIETNTSSNSLFNSVSHLKCEFIMDEVTIQFFAKRFRNIEVLEFGYLCEDVLLHVYEQFTRLKRLSVACPPAMYVSSRAYLGESKNIALTESRKAGFKLDIESRNNVAQQIRSSSDPSILYLKGNRVIVIMFHVIRSLLLFWPDLENLIMYYFL